MINCLIVDDEPLAQDILEAYVLQANQLSLVKKCSTAFEAFEVLHSDKIDLMFLDIKMPALNGIDFLKSLKNPPAIIFTTAYAEYAVASYELEAVDYLLKPITKERFDKSLAKLFKLKPIELTETKNYTYFKVSGKLQKVLHQDLRYAQSIKDYIMLYTKSGNLIVHMTMKYLCDLLPDDSFLRVQRSYLVNKTYVTAIGKNEVNLGDMEIPIGDSFKEAVAKEIGAM